MGSISIQKSLNYHTRKEYGFFNKPYLKIQRIIF